MVTILPHGLKITIEGAEGHGKTIAALAVQKALKNLGAWVAVKDADEIYFPDKSFAAHRARRSADFPLSETEIVVETKYPDE
jgi:hypothetical protein